MSKTVKYGLHSVTTYSDGIDIQFKEGRLIKWYTQRDNRYYIEGESNNVRNMGNVRRRISRKEFEEVYNLVVNGSESS